MCISGCKRSDPPSSTRNSTSDVDASCANCTVQCTASTITQPKGSLDSGSNPPDSWSGASPFHFDFQGVVAGCPGSYALSIAGTVAPSPTFTHGWSLDAAAGTLSSTTAARPTHTPPKGAGEGDLKLVAMNGSTAGNCKDKKRLKIYQDHLARDQENFAVGTSCRGPVWDFSRFGANIKMYGQWNCHGGTLHIYNGSGTGSVGPDGVDFLFDDKRLKKEVQVTHTPNGGGSHPPLGPLERGDIVAYFTGSGDLAHTQTCTGNGDETYGANNVPVAFPGRPNADEAWKWSTSRAGDWANDIKENIFRGATPFTIKVFRKP
jgi:hypothetical protein